MNGKKVSPAPNMSNPPKTEAPGPSQPQLDLLKNKDPDLAVGEAIEMVSRTSLVSCSFLVKCRSTEVN